MPLKSAGWMFSRSVPWTILLAAVLLLPQRGWSQQAVPGSAPAGKVLVLDPGHGGVDLGVASPKSYLEKSVALNLAQAIKTETAKYPQAAAILAREGDLDRPQAQRYEFANSKKADIFVSIHTGGGFSTQARPIEIFIAENRKGAELSGGWRAQNLRFSEENMRLAKSVSSRLSEVLPGREVKIIKTARLGLEGLAMPAILIEPIDLSNPNDEILLEEEGFTEKIAGAITAGIMDFLRIKLPEPANE